MKRRILAMLMSLVLMIGILPVTALAVDVVASGKCGDNLTWVIDTNYTLTISGKGEMWAFDDGWSTWYDYDDRIVDVVIEDGVTSIGAYAFTYLRISNLTIPASVTKIDPFAFKNCNILNGIWVDEDSKYYCNDEIGVLYEKDLEVLIKAPRNVKEIYVVPEGTVVIGTYAFYYCDFIGVTLPESLEVIEEYAFRDCYRFKTMNIPANVNFIGNNAFSGCDSIKEFIVDEKNEFYSGDEDGVLLNKDKTELIMAPYSLQGVYAVPEGVETIAANAFSVCYYHLTSVTLPKSVKFVDDYAFLNCDDLKTIIIKGDNVTLSEDAFLGCWNLSRIVFEGDIPRFFDSDFNWPEVKVYYPEGNGTWTEEFMAEYGAWTVFVEFDPENPDYIIRGECGDNLTWVIGDDNILTISGKGEMWDYDKYLPTWYDYKDILVDIVIEEGVTSIGAYAFKSHRINNVTIPASVNQIDPYAFANCYILNGIWVDEDNKYYFNDEIGVLYEKDLEVLIKVPWKSSENYVVPEGVVEIGPHAFDYCDFRGVTLPKSLEIIGDYAFLTCFRFTTINIPANVNSIADTAFFGCASIEEYTVDKNNEFYSNDKYGALFNKDKTKLMFVPGDLMGDYTIPASVTSIAPNAFVLVNRLERLIFEGDAPEFKSAYILSSITICYPENNPTWTQEAMASFGDNITWIPYTPKGDVNTDGRITNADLVMAARYIVGLYDAETVSDIKQYGDMNSDGMVNNTDLVTIARIIVGL